jgi:hypothetical protein
MYGSTTTEASGLANSQSWNDSPWGLFKATPPASCQQPDSTFKNAPNLGWPIHPLFKCDRSEAFWYDDLSSMKLKDVEVTDFRFRESAPVHHVYCRIPEDAEMEHPGDAISYLLPCWSAFMEFGGPPIAPSKDFLKLPRSNTQYSIVRKRPLPAQGWIKDICEQLGILFTTSLPIVKGSSRLGGPSVQKADCNVAECDEDSDFVVVRDKRRSSNSYHFSTVPFPTVRVFLDLLRGLILKGKLINNSGSKRYFLRPEHAYMLRSAMRLRDAASDQFDKNNSIKVLILNRLGTRRLLDSIRIEREIKDRASQTRIHWQHPVRVTQVDDLGAYNGLEQAKLLHNHDIIISPHGNQLSNIGFANECAALLEVYVEKMGIPGCFLPLAANAGVLSFGLYAGANIDDTSTAVVTHSARVRVRAHNIPLSDDVVNMVPAMLRARISCCQKLADEGHMQRAAEARCTPLLRLNEGVI